MLKIYNTFTRKKEEFKPIVDGFVGMYVCGPTVYGQSHLGHAKSYTNFDMIFRYLKYLGYKVKYVQNITDVGHLVGDGDDGDDKIAKQARLEKIDAYEVAYKYEVAHFENMDKLNILRPSISCRATGFVTDMIECIKTIIDKGYGYVTSEGNVYFDVHKYPKYGQLSNRKLDSTLSGERIEVAGDKKHPEDFALWKSVDASTLMRWDSPWGVGCPGWHIECTALGKKFLGDRFDIHGGGIDNIFPHHECECAQADIVNGHIPMNYFMHNGLVTVNGVKMGKSLGNFITLNDLFERVAPEVLRYFILEFHYRSSVDFNEEGLALAGKQLAKINEVVALLRSKTNSFKTVTDPELVDIKNKFLLAMDEDFNTPLALVEFNRLIKYILKIVDGGNENLLAEANTLVRDFGESILGLRFVEQEEKSDDIPENIKTLAENRWQAKLSKNWAEADKLRDELKNLGYVINDSKDGYTVEKA